MDLPDGLHLLVSHPVGLTQDFAPVLEPLYGSLLDKPGLNAQKLSHIIEYFDYVGRRFDALRQGLTPAEPNLIRLSPLEALLHTPTDCSEQAYRRIQSLSQSYAVEHFAQAAFLPGGRTLVDAAARWEAARVQLSEPQRRKLGAFLGVSAEEL